MRVSQSPSRTPRPVKKPCSAAQTQPGRQANLTYDHPRSLHFPGIDSMIVMQVTDYLIGVIDPHAVQAQQMSGPNSTVFDEWIALSAGA